MTAVATETPGPAEKALEATGRMPEPLEEEFAGEEEAWRQEAAEPPPGAADTRAARVGDHDAQRAAGSTLTHDPPGGPEPVAGPAARMPEQAVISTQPVVSPGEQAGAAAEQLAAAVTAALRPDSAPLDYAPCRQGVGAAVQRLRDALTGLITELEPRIGTAVPDSAVARARHLAGDIRFVRPLDFG